MGFKWATEFCSNAHFIMKTDDDVYVNINGLFRTLLIHGSSLTTSVAGICELGSLRDTNPSSKWYVSPREYPYVVIMGFVMVLGTSLVCIPCTIYSRYMSIYHTSI